MGTELKYKVGDITIWDAISGLVQEYEVTDVSEKGYKLKLLYCSMGLTSDYHDWYPVEETENSSRLLTKLEKALK